MKLISEIKQFADDYKTSSIEISEGIQHSQSKIIKICDLYTSSIYKNGNKFPNGRRKPFYNIVNTLVDTAIVATDIDFKDINVESDSSEDYDKSFVFNKELHGWMKDTNFSMTLNQMGETRARYGGVLVKKRETNGQLYIEIPEWKNVITDQVRIIGSPIVEKHFLTKHEVSDKSDIWNNTKEAIKLFGEKGYTSITKKIEIWEVTGTFPKSCLSNDPEVDDEDETSIQRHFFAINGEKYVHLYYEELDEFPYKYLAWKRIAGRDLGRGVIEEAEESQVWTNDSVQKEHAILELASKIVGVTTSKKFAQNVLTDMDNGEFKIVEPNSKTELLNLLPSNAVNLLNTTKDAWWSQAERSTSSYDAIRGETPPSGQPYRLQALVTQQSASAFDYRKEEWGIFLNEIIVDWVFPFIEKKINKKHLLSSDFSPTELSRIDDCFAKYSANEMILDAIAEGKNVYAEDYDSLQSQYRELIKASGSRRFLDVPDNYYKGMKKKLTINITGEQKNKLAALDSLNSLLDNMIPLVATGAVTIQDIQLVMNKILELTGTGISPISLTQQKPAQAMDQSVQGQQPNQQQMQQPVNQLTK